MLGFRRRGVSGAINPGRGVITPFYPLPTVFADGDTDDWRLAVGFYQASIHTFALWMPPSTESYAFHKLAPAGYARRIRYPVAGGHPPYHFTLNAGPSGASFNNDWDDPDYGTLTIPNVPEQVGTISVTAEQQQGAPITFSHDFAGRAADDTDYFCHLIEGSGGSAEGTPSNPLRNLGQLIGPDENADQWQGVQVIVEGAHTIGGQEAEYNVNGSRLVMNDNKPAVWVAAELHGAQFNGGGDATGTGGAEFHFENGNNVKFQGFQWVNPYCNQGSGTRNCFIHAASPIFAGGGTQDNDFDMTAPAAPGGSNSCGIFYASSAGGQYAHHIGDTFRNCQTVAPMQVYAATFVYLGNITTIDVGTDVGLHLKGGAAIEDVFMFLCRSTGTGPLTCIQAIQGGPPWSRQRIELMHCRAYSSGTAGNQGKPIWLLGGGAGSTYSVYVKRCNLRGLYSHAQSIAAGSVNMSHSVVQHNGTYTEGWRNDGGPTYNSDSNRTATTGLLDTSGAQTSPNYTQGAEII